MGKLNDEDLAQSATTAYERLRAYPDRTLAQMAIAESAAGVVEDAINMVPRDGGRDPLRDIDAAAQLLHTVEKLLQSTVLAARIDGQSWDAIGRAITSDPNPTRRHAQAMINKYGRLEQRWKHVLLEPVDAIRDEDGTISSIFQRRPAGLTPHNLDGQARRLQRLLDEHHSGAELGLPEDTAAARQDDYLWRLKAATEEYGLSRIPAELAADIDARKAAAEDTKPTSQEKR
jgi:hypothetical protein